MIRRALIAENTWRATRYGIEGKLIDFGTEEEVLFHDLCAWEASDGELI